MKYFLILLFKITYKAIVNSKIIIGMDLLEEVI